MSRISSYPIQDIVIGADKWIGSDALNDAATKNFTADAVAIFLNNDNKIESNALRYRYQNWVTGQTRDPGTISFETSNAGSKSFSLITSIVLSQFQYNSTIDVSSYYTVPLLNSVVVISQASNPSNFGIYNWTSVTERKPETKFFDIGLTLQASTGSLIIGKDYFISLLTYGLSSSDKNYVFTQDTSLNPWVVNHGLNKYAAVSVTSSTDEVVYADVQYDSKNVVTITFNGPQTGKAFFN
tara:strand:+ start:371 stop:1090 length:720 start_codon:yes stop_codon:yes gene_type:complete